MAGLDCRHPAADPAPVEGSDRDVALALRERLQPGDRVVFVGKPFFDVPFYARLRETPLMLAYRNDPRIPLIDAWRKEQLDAGSFDPNAARRILGARPRRGAAAVWFRAATGWRPTPDLGADERITAGHHAMLWRGPSAQADACR